MKIKVIYFLAIYLMLSSTCFSQERSYRSIPAKYEKSYKRAVVPKGILSDAVNVIKYLPKDYVKDGSINYTKNIQRAIDENKVLIFPAYIFSITGLELRSNSTLVFEKGSLLKMIPSDQERYEILSMAGVENVVLYNPKIQGDLRSRKALKGEWGFGIDIRGSKNINVYSPYISDCLGDGIVISKSYKGIKDSKLKLFNTSDIVIKDAFVDYMGRNGISIIGVDGLRIISPIITNIFKRSPMSGIDIEPDNSSYEVNNIIIDSPFTFNNTDGIMINLRRFVSERTKYSNITINNHVDVESLYPLNIPDFKSNEKHKAILGKLVINSPVWINNGQSMVRGKSYKLSHKIELNNPKIIGLKLRTWKGKSIQNLNNIEKLRVHIKDDYNFSINK